MTFEELTTVCRTRELRTFPAHPLNGVSAFPTRCNLQSAVAFPSVVNELLLWEDHIQLLRLQLVISSGGESMDSAEEATEGDFQQVPWSVQYKPT